MGQKAKVIKALFMLVISTCFASLCITFAWFTAQRIRDVGGTDLNLSALNGEMYYYQGNYNQTGPNDREWSGYLGNTDQTGALNKDGTPKTFVKYDADAAKANPKMDNPFNMNSMKPSSRFLFFIKAKLVHPRACEVSFEIDNWTSTTSELENKNTKDGSLIYLSRAMYMYTCTTPIIVSDETNLPMDEVMAWADSKKVSSNDDPIYQENAFKDSQGNPFNSEKNTTGAPVVLGKWTFQVNQTYLIPFILEFTNHKASYFSFHEPVNGEKAGWYYPDSVDGTSNVYTNMYFNIDKLSLTHVVETGN